MLFHIPKQSNWVECVVIDFFASFLFRRRGEFENFVLGQRNNYNIHKRVCTGMFVCVFVLRVRVKTFNTW